MLEEVQVGPHELVRRLGVQRDHPHHAAVAVEHRNGHERLEPLLLELREVLHPRVLERLLLDERRTPGLHHPSGEALPELHADDAGEMLVGRGGRPEHQAIAVEEPDQAGVAPRRLRRQPDDPSQDRFQVGAGSDRLDDLIEVGAFVVEASGPPFGGVRDRSAPLLRSHHRRALPRPVLLRPYIGGDRTPGCRVTSNVSMTRPVPASMRVVRPMPACGRTAHPRGGNCVRRAAPGGHRRRYAGSRMSRVEPPGGVGVGLRRAEARVHVVRRSARSGVRGPEREGRPR